jgi:2-polyprenyl-3-methyl-5-hydroxy-6-metoxy-1,4-benzoquinol methylase
MPINSKEFLEKQYGISNNLDIRIRLHELYSTNKEDWHKWLFKNFQINDDAKIVEFGCGSGVLWAKNKDGIRPNWNITLTDFSEGMLHTAKENIGNLNNIFYRQIDIQDISYTDNNFDIAIANHMLYHVPNLNEALIEVNRILKPSGVFYAATNGINHMKEIFELVHEFDDSLSISNKGYEKIFGIENGEKILKKYFSEVSFINYSSDLNVTNAIHLMDYILSMDKELEEKMSQENKLEFKDFLQTKVNNNGFISITKEVGLFVALKRDELYGV